MIKDLGTWENTQAKKDAQISNPATQITPTDKQQATPASEQVVTADPSNGGITPSSGKSWGFDLGALNRGLQAAGIWGSTDLGKSYGISGNGVTEDQTKNLPGFISDESGNTYERKVVKATNEMDQAKRTSFLKDMQWVDLSKKQANSGAAIHPDIGTSFSDTTDLASGFMKSTQIFNNKELVWNGSIAKFKWAYDAFTQALQEAEKMQDISARTSYMQESIGELKMAMIPLVEKAKGIIYATEGGKTAWYDRLNEFGKGLEKYAKLYKSSAIDIQNTIKSYSEQDSKFSVAYQKLDYTAKSENAKSRLRSNPAYTTFMEIMMEANPDKAGIIRNMVNNTTITDDEKSFLEEKFIGGSFKELFESRAQAIKDFWPSAASWFKDFEDIIEVKNELYKTRMDDINESMVAPVIDPNRLVFAINSWY